ncbi:hypothetical protein SPD48_17630 [Pseudogracilibacillus sp. SE30717A]|uniref:hypothetical protein n=1 Tax=Pseudogracilibacillus sp. SE30717A TaxID=3098293 RepID=UPI00300E34DC
MEKLKEVLGFALFTLFFGLITSFLTIEYMDEYDILSAEKVDVPIIQKVGEKNLFTPPSYFVRVELPHGEESEYLSRISKHQMKEVEPGDHLSGFTTNGRDFLTWRDFIIDGFIFLGAILLFGAFTLLGVFMLLSAIPAVDRFFEEKTFLGRRTIGNGMKLLTIAISVFVYFSGRFLHNLLLKLFPFMKTSTEAKIIDSYSYFSYRKYEDSVYEFTILFEDVNGNEIEVIKEVTRSTFNHYTLGESLPISYRTQNPYDVFVNQTTFADIFGMVVYLELFMYLFFIATIIFTGYVLLNKRKKNKSRAD